MFRHGVIELKGTEQGGEAWRQLFIKKGRVVTAENRKQFSCAQEQHSVLKENKRGKWAALLHSLHSTAPSSIRHHVARHWHTEAEDSKDPFALHGLH